MVSLLIRRFSKLFLSLLVLNCQTSLCLRTYEFEVPSNSTLYTTTARHIETTDATTTLPESITGFNFTFHTSAVNSSIDDNHLPVSVFRPVWTQIRNGDRHTYHYNFQDDYITKWPAFLLEFYAESDEQPHNGTVHNYPLHVAVHWHNSIRSWSIPILYLNETMAHSKKDRFTHHSIGKTLWLYPDRSSSDLLRLTIDVSIVSTVVVTYRIRIKPLKNFLVNSTQLTHGLATRSSPTFFKFDFPEEEDWEFAFLSVESKSEICTKFSVEQPRGPFLEADADADSHWGGKQFSETITMKAGLTVRVADFPDGLLIVFYPFLDDKKCMTEPLNDSSQIQDAYRVKQVDFEVKQGPSTFNFPYHYPLTFPIALFIGFAILALVLHSYFHRYRNCRKKKNPVLNRQLSLSPAGCCKPGMTIDELIITDPSRVVGQSKRYCAASVVTSAFYSVPVFQLIFTFSARLRATGDLDICYYNSFCSHTVGQFNDFNHMYSNIWYVLFDLLFKLFVFIRQFSYDTKYREPTEEEEQAPKNLFRMIFPKTDGRLGIGVMKHYGLLYCMGYALIMTGVMSAAYHVCPNQNNFQFDTVFMYTIAAITVVTSYQARHPTYLSANFTFTALAMVTFITVLGLLWEDTVVRIIFSGVHTVFLLLSLPKVCYNGYVRRDGRLVADWLEMMKILFAKFKDDWKNGRIIGFQKQVWRMPSDAAVEVIPGRGRFILPGFLSLVNSAAIAGTWTYFREENFATQVLCICVINGALYIVFYSTLKILHGECRDYLWIQPAIYLVFSVLCWVFALVHFFRLVSTWESSPAESRLRNTDCIYLEFYDYHDMWHFLSAVALFCSAMVLLTVDDDWLDRPKTTIPVF